MTKTITITLIVISVIFIYFDKILWCKKIISSSLFSNSTSSKHSKNYKNNLIEINLLSKNEIKSNNGQTIFVNLI